MLSTTATAFCQGSPAPTKREAKSGFQNGPPSPAMPLRNSGGSPGAASHCGSSGVEIFDAEIPRAATRARCRRR